jgi:hypothetical protein
MVSVAADPKNYMAHIHLSLSLKPLTAMYGNHIIPEACRKSTRNPDTTTIQLSAGSLQKILQYYNS